MKIHNITSLEISEITGKSHKHVLRDIRNIVEDLEEQEISTEPNFGLSEYVDSTGRPLPMYQLTKKGALLLASGYDTTLRYKIIDRLEKLELAVQMSTPAFEVPTPREIAYLILRLEDEKEQLQNELVLAAPKVEYTDKVLTSVSGIRTTQIAKELGMSAQKLNQSLKFHGIQYKRNDQWVLTAKYQSCGFTETVTVPVKNKLGQTITSHLTVWTEQGRRFIHSLLNGNLQMQASLFANDQVALNN
jgi:Rha family phage regulatory protein